MGIVSFRHQKYSYEEYVKDLQSMQERFPDICQINTVGMSLDKRKIYEVILGNPAAKKHLFVLANLHAREYMTIVLCMKQMEYHLMHYRQEIEGIEISDLSHQVAIHYFPSCNPDGTVISQFGFDAIREEGLREQLYTVGENPVTWKENGRNVDLNRNWNSSYFHLLGKGRSRLSGEKPESEPETQAVLNAVNQTENTGRIVGIISYHSTGSVIFGKCADEASVNVKHETEKMYQLAQKLTGYELMPVEAIEDTLGCSREYFLYTRGIPFITIEIGKGDCPLSVREFPDIWRRNKALVIKEAMLFYERKRNFGKNERTSEKNAYGSSGRCEKAEPDL